MSRDGNEHIDVRKVWTISSDRFKRYLIQPAQIYLSNKLVVRGEKEDPCPGRRLYYNETHWHLF